MSKTAIITGAGQGIGQGIAYQLAKDGYAIAAVDIRKDTVDQTVIKIKEEGGKAKAYYLDVAKRDEVFNLVEQATKDLGPLAVMVNNAGVAFIETFIKSKPEQIDRLFDVNLKGTYWGMQAAGQKFIQQGKGGRIINAASLAGVEASALQSAYSASKFGIRGLTQAAAKEFAPYHITVNAYNPGVVRTPLRDMIDDKTAKIKHKTIPEQQADVLTEIPLGREAKPTDVANLVSWLVSPKTNYITGQSFMVDGGMHFL